MTLRVRDLTPLRLAGEDAFYTMLRWNTGDFVIEHGIRGKQRTIDCDPMFLLMEGLRLLDEERDPDKPQPAANTTQTQSS